MQQMKEFYDKCNDQLTSATLKIETAGKKYSGRRLTKFEEKFMQKEQNDLDQKLENLKSTFEKQLTIMDQKISKQIHLEQSLSSGRNFLKRETLKFFKDCTPRTLQKAKRDFTPRTIKKIQQVRSQKKKEGLDRSLEPYIKNYLKQMAETNQLMQSNLLSQTRNRMVFSP